MDAGTRTRDAREPGQAVDLFRTHSPTSLSAGLRKGELLAAIPGE